MATFQNYAKLSYNGGTTLSNLVTGEIVEALQMTKTAVRRTYGPEDRITYVVSIVNSGTDAFTGLTLSDDLGTYMVGTAAVTPLEYVDGSVLLYVGGELQTAPAVTAGPPLTFAGIQLPAGSSALLIYEAAVNEYAPLTGDTGVVNTATLTGGGLAAPVTAEETILPQEGVELSIAKFVTPETVTENGELTYCFVISNYGGMAAEAADNVSVSDTFDPILNPINVTLNGTARGADLYTYNPQTGVFVTTPGAITVPAASYAQDTATGAWTITPGTVTLTVSGTI